MADLKSYSASKVDQDYLTAPRHPALSDSNMSTSNSNDDPAAYEPMTPGYASSTPSSPYMLSRNSSYFGRDGSDEFEETPIDKLTVFDFVSNLALTERLEKIQTKLAAQKDKVLRQQERIRLNARDKAIAEWRKRIPNSDEQLTKYRRRMKTSVDNLNKKWNDTVTISMREKISFISAVLNIFISGYLVGAVPEYFYWWFTVQFVYFMPIRWFTYHKIGYHYFLADLCYFVNALTLLTVWAFPQSKRLFISTYCLAYGNNAVAIVMWRNSLVFHSLDKVTSLFVHIMPPVTLHCLVHLTPAKFLEIRFPAVYDIKFSPPESPEHYSLWAMLTWATLPYAAWQLSYHFFITIRRREKIAAGRPTSFTWLRKSYAKTWIGKIVLALPASLQEPAFMFIQYSYACLTIVPCPLWFWYRWASASFMMFCFSWSVWNGANYYMDVFGKKFQKELEQLKRDMVKLQNSPGSLTPTGGPAKDEDVSTSEKPNEDGLDRIPLLDEQAKEKTQMDVINDMEREESVRATGARLLDDGPSAKARKTKESEEGGSANY